ncbi:MAG: hypothetical protein ACKN92_06840, partial [Candidatus Nanopelagicaceae bacterium]
TAQPVHATPAHTTASTTTNNDGNGRWRRQPSRPWSWTTCPNSRLVDHEQNGNISLTTVAMPLTQTGDLAIETILSLINKLDQTVKPANELKTSLILRNSTGVAK